jgi:hypothetical protein
MTQFTKSSRGDLPSSTDGELRIAKFDLNGDGKPDYVVLGAGTFYCG